MYNWYYSLFSTRIAFYDCNEEFTGTSSTKDFVPKVSANLVPQQLPCIDLGVRPCRHGQPSARFNTARGHARAVIGPCRHKHGTRCCMRTLAANVTALACLHCRQSMVATAAELVCRRRQAMAMVAAAVAAKPWSLPLLHLPASDAATLAATCLDRCLAWPGHGKKGDRGDRGGGN